MIDYRSEEMITLAQAAKSLPSGRGGKPRNVSSLYRWSAAGVRGIKLETVQIGGCRYTSRQALDRFFEALAGKPTASRATLTRERQAELSRHDAELAALGL